MRLSAEAWSQGIGSFFVHAVPFSFGTGPLFASSVTKILAHLAGDGPVHVYELGAGAGVLSRNVLDSLERDQPALYERTTYHVTEYAEALVDQMRTLRMFESHAGHVDLRCQDAQQFEWRQAEPPTLIICSYLINALGYRQFEVREGQLHEVLVSTDLAADASVLDASQVAPRRLDAAQITALLEGDDLDRRRALAPSILPYLIETLHSVPIDGGVSLTDAERSSVHARADALPAGADYRWNHPIGFVDRLHTILDRLPRGAAMLVHDIGVCTTEDNRAPEALIRRYGATAAAAVDFPLLLDIADAHGVAGTTTEHPGVVSQTALLHRASPDTAQVFADVTQAAQPSRIQKAIDDLAAAIDADRVEAALPEIEALTDLERQDYTLALKLALASIAIGDVDRAINVLEESIELYHPMALPSRVMLGTMAAASGALDEARCQFDEALDVAPDLPEALLGLAKVARSQGEDRQYVELMCRWLSATSVAPDTAMFLELATALSALGDNRRAAEVLLSVQSTMFETST